MSYQKSLSKLILFIGFVSSVSSIYAQGGATYSLSTDSMVNRTASDIKVYRADYISEKIKIDGELDDAAWSHVKWEGEFVQQQPLQANAPSQQTEFCILYDRDNLYIALKCYDDEPEKIRSILSRRDEMSGDIAGVAIDSYADKRTAFEFNVSAAGQKVDLMHLGAYQWDYNWDAIWEGKSAVKDSMWTIEMRIPFSQLRFSDKEEQVWGMHIWRWIDRNSEEDQWKLIPVDAPAMVYLFGELRGIKGINAKRKMEFLPYSSFKYSPNTDLENSTRFDIGLDGKIGLSSDFTLDYTVNPDFGQVEADPSELSLSSYEVFYDEKRPFFLEGNNVLDFSMGRDLLFYSRRIGRAPSYRPGLQQDESLSMPDNTSIISALKVTGKNKKGLSLGVVQSFTANEKATVYSPGNEEQVTVEPFSNHFVGRVKQDFNEGNTVLGGIVTSSVSSINEEHLEFLPHSSLVGGVDFQHNWKKRKYFIDLKSFYSRIGGTEEAIADLQLASQHYFQRPGADHLTYDPSKTSLIGHGGQLTGGKQSGKFRANGTFSWRSPGVDLNNLGYMYQADYLEGIAEFKYQVNKPIGIFRDYYLKYTQKHEWSYGGETTKEEFQLHSYTRFTNLWRMHAFLEHDYNVFDTRELRGGPKLFKDDTWETRLFFQSNNAKNLLFAGGPHYIWSVDGISKRDRYNFTVRWQIGDRFSIYGQMDYEDLTDYHQYVRRLSLSDSSTGYLVGKMDRKTISTTLRLEYFITPEISLQYYANPYASVAKYSDFRRVNEGDSKDLNDRYFYAASVELENNSYSIKDETGEEYAFVNPNFDYKELRSNLVARWEFRPGSTLYLVWNTSSILYERSSNYSVSKSYGDLFGVKSDNVFMIKFNYWFSL
ncbi:DUF5916 domain-containing protein [Sunxiuqinia indica]|uniref:DUF5916 domain-containing protein n=1 Tax=Sunxiuqinia indica TaxID=2692584 RepID=UPI00135804D8|nr:DUF5916 domain-containing protein [Sunxiuqinia indica]